MRVRVLLVFLAISLLVACPDLTNPKEPTDDETETEDQVAEDEEDSEDSDGSLDNEDGSDTGSSPKEGTLSVDLISGQPGTMVTLSTFPDGIDLDQCSLLLGEDAVELFAVDATPGEAVFWVPLIEAGSYNLTITGPGETSLVVDTNTFTVLEIDASDLPGEPGDVIGDIVGSQTQSFNTMSNTVLPLLTRSGMLTNSQSSLVQEELSMVTTLLEAAVAELENATEEERILIDRALSEAGVDFLANQSDRLASTVAASGLTDVLQRDYDHTYLVAMDAYSAVLSNAEKSTAKIGEMASKLKGVGNLASGSCTALSIGFKIVTGLIDFYMPTDLQSVSIVNTPADDECVVPADGESEFVLMGHFEPESNPLETGMSSIFDYVSSKVGNDKSNAIYVIIRKILAAAGLTLEDELIGMDMQSAWGDAIATDVEIDREVYAGGTEMVVGILRDRMGSAGSVEDAPLVLQFLPTAGIEVEDPTVATIDERTGTVTAVGEGETRLLSNAFCFKSNSFSGNEPSIAQKLSESEADFGTIYVTSIVPRSGSTGVAPDTDIRFYFDRTVASKLSPRVTLDGTTYTESEAAFTIEGSNCVVFKPDEPFESGSTLSGISIDGFEDQEGNSLEKRNREYSFTTGSSFIEFSWMVRTMPGTETFSGGKPGIVDGPSGEVFAATAADDGLTHIVAFEKENSDRYFEMSFEGDEPGNYYNYATTVVFVTAPGQAYFSTTFDHIEDVTVECTKIGDVGGMIEGTFSATLYLSTDESVVMKVRDGRFAVQRVSKLNW